MVALNTDSGVVGQTPYENDGIGYFLEKTRVTFVLSDVLEGRWHELDAYITVFSRFS
jgi:hypothetical protein